MIEGKKLLLASASPRRRELLAALDTDVQIIQPANVDETYPSTLTAEQVPEYIARLKRDACDTTLLRDDEVLVTADTVVILDGEVLGKPHSREDAIKMLGMMSGKCHKVITGVTLTTSKNSISFSTETLVYFDSLTDRQIEYYVDRYKPLDKAGAYGIQEWIGYIGISRIEGCYYNVMGLPLHDLYRNLAKL